MHPIWTICSCWGCTSWKPILDDRTLLRKPPEVARWFSDDRESLHKAAGARRAVAISREGPLEEVRLVISKRGLRPSSLATLVRGAWNPWGFPGKVYQGGWCPGKEGQDNCPPQGKQFWASSWPAWRSWRWVKRIKRSQDPIIRSTRSAWHWSSAVCQVWVPLLWPVKFSWVFS